VRDNLVAALASCANNLPARWRTKRFLTGLSSDELEFIAGYLGSCILESAGRPLPQVAVSRRDIGRARDREHKMILVREFLGRTGIRWTPAGTSRFN